MHQQDIDRIKAYCDKATAGPWTLHFYNVPGNPVYALEAGGEDGDEGEFGQLWGGGGPDEWPAEANADFITHARTDLPACVAELERLQKELAEAQQKVKHLISDSTDDDTTIRELCRPFMDVDGDSYGVPPIGELVEQLVKQFNALKLKHDAALNSARVTSPMQPQPPSE